MSYSIGEGTTIRKLLGGMVKYEIPRYQRKYVWKKKHWQDLFEDLCFVYERNISGDKLTHFFSSFIFERKGNTDGIDNFIVIDGQQRISTTSVILATLCRLLIERNSQQNHALIKQYLSALDSRGPYIKLSNDNADLLGEIITNNLTFVPSNELIPINIKKYHNYTTEQKNIYNCYKYFYEKISTFIRDHETSNEIEKIMYFANCLLDMQVVQINVDQEQEGYDIFEILNARGTPLAQHELLKNYIFKYYKPIGDIDNAKQMWLKLENNLTIEDKSYLNIFINHYTIHKYRKPDNRKEDTVLRIIKQSNKSNSTKDILDDLYLKSKFYRWLLNASDFLRNDIFEKKEYTENIYSIITYFNLKNQSQFRPLLISMFSKLNQFRLVYDDKREEYEKGTILKAEYTNAKKEFRQYEKKVNEAISYLLNFSIIELVVKKQQPKVFEQKVHSLAQKIEMDYQQIELLQKELKPVITYEMFLSSFVNLGYSNKMDIYHREKTSVDIRQLIRMYELYLQSTDELLINNMTIEHILNDSETDINACLIGNLLPLSEDLQKEIGSKTEIIDKLPIYKKSNFKTVEEFVSNYNGLAAWGAEQIAQRSRNIADVFYYKIFELV